MAFASLLGHERVRDLLGRALAAGRVPPALLFTGPRGVGKRSLAMALGQALVCPLGRPACDGSCGSCRRAAAGHHPDMMLLEAETAVIKIEQVRGMAREILGRPFEAPARAFVIDEAERFTDQAANALLKSLEEPPATSHVMLISAAPQALLPTIRSRCQTFRFGPLSLELLECELARRGLTAEESRLRAIASGGSLGDALSLESDAYRALRDDLVSALETLEGAGAVGATRLAERLAEDADPELPLLVLRALLRDVAALAAGAGAERLLNRDVADRLARLADGPIAARATSLAEWCGETLNSLRGNAAKLLAMDVVGEAALGRVSTEDVPV